MNVLIIGSGGREHALAWKCAQSPLVKQVYVAPGNGGTSWPQRAGFAPSETVNLPISEPDFSSLIAFAMEKSIGLTIVGPEVPLAAGIVDFFQAADLSIYGPTKAAAQLEASKAFSKAFMAEFGIPTAAYSAFTEKESALSYLDGLNYNVVVKASGLAAGKGVIVCDDHAEARQAIAEMMDDRRFGDAGNEIIIEERLTGPELSLLAACDGTTAQPLLITRDHKRVFENDEGPNTGGMGAYGPVPEVEQATIDEIMNSVIQPAIDGMAKRGTPYVGVLFAGLMLTPNGIKTLEFNCRFGDPETQVALPMLKNDLVEVALASIEGRLDEHTLESEDGACATVVMTSPGYPGSYPKGLPISGIDLAAESDDTIVFHAGTKADGDQIVTNGGRVLAVTGRGESLNDALSVAYAGIEKISFNGAHYRKDIAATSL